MNEFSGRDVLTKAAIEQGSLFYLIADDEIKENRSEYQSGKIDRQVEAGTLIKADTIEELAVKVNMDPQVLRTTIDKYNSYVDAGFDPEFHKDTFSLKVEKRHFTLRLESLPFTIPWVALKSIPKPEYWMKTVSRSPIFMLPGKWQGIHAGNRLGGNALTDIFTFGRIAGKTAVEEMNRVSNVKIER